MAKFIPRSVGRGETSHDRGGSNQRFQHRGRGMSWPRGRGRGGFSDRGNRGGYNNFRGRGQRGHFRGRGSFIPSDKGPVSIIYPDDPRHPDFDKDPRNAGLKARGKVRDEDMRRSDDEDSPERRGQDSRREREDDLTNMSDEGLRITVENKASSMTVADPSFYDEIQPRQAPSTSSTGPNAAPSSRASKEKENSEAQSSSSTRSKKQSKKSSKESIRITVGNDRFADDSQDGRPSASPATESKQDSPHESADREHSQSSTRNEGRQPIRDGNQTRGPPNPRDRSQDKSRRSRSLSRSGRRSRSRSRGRYRRNRSTSRSRTGRRRTRSRSRDRFPDRGRRGPYRSRSRDRFGSHSPRGSRRRRSRSRSPGWRPRRSRSRSRGRVRRSYSRGRSYSRSPSRGRMHSRSPVRRSSKSPGRKRDWSCDRFSPVSDTSLGSPRNTSVGPGGDTRHDFKQKTKDNPIMDFLNDFPKSGDRPPPEKSAVAQDPSRTPPWLKDSSKAANILEIEKYLESKLKEARGGYETKQEPQSQEPPPTKYSTKPREMTSINQSKHTELPKQTTPSGWHEVQPARNPEKPERAERPQPQTRKEPEPFDIYDDLSKREESQRLATPPPLESKPVKSILKNKKPDSQKSNDTHGDPFIATEEKPMPGMASLMNIEDEDAFLYGDISETPVETVAAKKPEKKPATPAEVGSELDSVYLGGYSGNKTDPGWEVAEPAQGFSDDFQSPGEQSKSDDPKTESDKLSADPTIQNILKSIGFNFELSKLMQEKAEKSRKKEEDLETYGIKQGSSFLGGHVPGPDMHSALGAANSTPEPAERKQRQERKPIGDRKESYEERARRYLEEQQKQIPPRVDDGYGSTGYTQQQSFEDSGYPQHQQDYYDNQYHQQGFETFDYNNQSAPVPQSNLSTIQSEHSSFGQGAPMDQGGSQSGLHGLQSQYDELESYRNDERMYHRREDEFEKRHHSESRDFEARVAQSSSRDRAPSYDRGEAKTLFPIIREKSPSRSMSPAAERRSSSGSSRRTVLPPKRESRESPARETRRTDTKQTTKPVKTESTDKKSIKKVSTMSTKEREELVQEINERAKRLKLLEKELSRLRKQENELMRKKQRQKDGHKDQLLEQNTQLQQEIGQQIKVLRRAAEVNARLLVASRRDDEADIDFLALIKEPSDQKPSLKRSPSPSPRKTVKKEPKEKDVSDSKDGGEESKKMMKLKFEYFDPGNHWCRQCNHVSTNVYEFFGHLQSKKHSTKLDPYDRPWIISQKEKQKEPASQSVAAAFKGVEFIMPTQAFYCSLCKSFSGDMTCAEEHVKSSEHNEKYQEYVDENPFYERRYQLDKAAGLSTTSVTKDARSDDEGDHNAEKTSSKSKRKQEREDSRPKDESRYKQEPGSKDKGDSKYKDETKYREDSRHRENSRSTSEERTRRSERAKRYADFEESEGKLIRKKARLLEEKKKAAEKKRQESEPQERKEGKEARRHEEEMDCGLVEKRTISAAPRPSEQKSFGKLLWKGPMIGKAPCFKKGKAPAAEPPSEKISIKLGGRLTRGVAKTSPMPASKVVTDIQDVEDPAKDPNYVSKKNNSKQLKSDGSPEPLDIFVTVGRKKETKSMPTISCDPGPIRQKGPSPTVIADAFSGKSDDKNQDVEPKDKRQSKRMEVEPIPVPRGTKEEEREMKLLGIEFSDTVTVPVKPTQLVLPPSSRASDPTSMTSTSTDKIYDVFFGSKDGKSDNKGQDN